MAGKREPPAIWPRIIMITGGTVGAGNGVGRWWAREVKFLARWW